MAAPARPLDDGAFEPVDEQAPLIRALVRGLIEHTRTGIVTLDAARDANAPQKPA